MVQAEAAAQAKRFGLQSQFPNKSGRGIDLAAFLGQMFG